MHLPLSSLDPTFASEPSLDPNIGFQWFWTPEPSLDPNLGFQKGSEQRVNYSATRSKLFIKIYYQSERFLSTTLNHLQDPRFCDWIVTDQKNIGRLIKICVFLWRKVGVLLSFAQLSNQDPGLPKFTLVQYPLDTIQVYSPVHFPYKPKSTLLSSDWVVTTREPLRPLEAVRAPAVLLHLSLASSPAKKCRRSCNQIRRVFA